MLSDKGCRDIEEPPTKHKLSIFSASGLSEVPKEFGKSVDLNHNEVDFSLFLHMCEV